MATEKRLIEVETVIRKIRNANCADCDNCNAVLCRACWVDDVISLLDDSPKVDAVEVVHGCTIPAEQPKKVLLNRKCGVCDSLMLSTDAYCPNCGAKMDGDGNG